MMEKYNKTSRKPDERNDNKRKIENIHSFSWLKEKITSFMSLPLTYKYYTYTHGLNSCLQCIKHILYECPIFIPSHVRYDLCSIFFSTNVAYKHFYSLSFMFFFSVSRCLAITFSLKTKDKIFVSHIICMYKTQCVVVRVSFSLVLNMWTSKWSSNARCIRKNRKCHTALKYKKKMLNDSRKNGEEN